MFKLVCCSVCSWAMIAAAHAQHGIEGTWKLVLGKRTLLVLSLASTNTQNGQQCKGTLSLPTHLTTRDGITFFEVYGPTKVQQILTCTEAAGALTLTVRDEEEANGTTTYSFHTRDANHAELEIRGAPLPPLQLVRAGADATVATDWEGGRKYTPEDDASSNPQMKQIFDEDQKVRQAWPNIDWNIVDKSDAERRTAVRKLLQDGALHSGEDFYEAAHVFQHGSGPDDNLLAHTLSMVAVRKGYDAAIWIAAATLDRYLQSIKQPQIYGTQFFTPGTQPATQEPYHRDLISDALRRQLDVPNLAAQDVQRQKYDTDRHIGAAASEKKP
ncbi:hypothetical protein [Terriglobus sp.]|uniref:hypothetical protein n=1 Tax=Terriglobus sp. TaxID=1889013 RepID=UPI003AFFF961